MLVKNRVLLWSVTPAAILMMVSVSWSQCGTMSKSDVDKSLKQGSDVLEIAVNDGRFTTLAAAIQAAGLVETLKQDGPFTIFAPTDDAFAKLPEGTVESLLLPENRDKLAGILTYHVVSGKVLAEDVVKLDEARTIQGSHVTINTEGEHVMVNSSKVILTDVIGTNGVIHVIDEVLLPPA